MPPSVRRRVIASSTAFDVVVCGQHELGAPGLGALMHAGMGEFVEDQRVALLRQRGQESEVAAEEHRVVSPEERRRDCLQ